MKILSTVILTVLVLIAIALIVIYSGLYNVSAINQDRGITRWVLNTTMDNSVEHYSKGLTAPNLNDTSMIREGIAHYKEMCEICHNAPGKEPSELSKGLNPHAPDLIRIGFRMDPVEVFWITKNGIKMTGMPAWGPTHSDEKIWAIVAAVKKLHDISPRVYNSIQTEMDEDNNQTQMNRK
jgi:mono/diheme cytochrome c family protein